MKKSQIGLAAVCVGAFWALANGAQAQAIYSTDALWANNTWNYSIQTFNPDGTQSSFAYTQDIDASGIAVGSSGNLYLKSFYGNINIYSPDGLYLSTFANTGSSGNAEIVFNGAGDLFAACGSQVYEFAPDGSSLGTFATVNYATGMAVDNAGNLFVADVNANAVDEFAPNGSLVRQFSGGLNGAFGVAVNGAGDLFVANQNSGTISEFAADGSSLGTFASGLSGSGDLKFDGSGNLYVANGSSINEYNTSGQVINTLVPSDGSSPQYLAVQPSQPVPEPTTLALAGLGGLALLGFRRRKA